MASFRKRGKTWLAEVRLKGVHRYATFPTKAEAVEWAGELERKVRQGHRPVAHDRTVGDLLERYARDVSPRKPGRQWEQTRIAWFLRQPFTRLRVSEFSPRDLAAWRDERLLEVSGETIRRDMALLSHCFSVATREWEWMHENPMARVQRPKGSVGRERIATDEEIERLCYVAGYQVGQGADSAAARVCAAFVFATETGCRGKEICGIQEGDTVGSVLVLRKTKNGEGRNVPLSDKARIGLLDVGGNFQLSVRQKDAIFRKLRAKAGITGLNFHDSRATAITRLSRKLDILALARMVGHRDLSMLQRYYRESAEEIARRLG